MIPHGATARHSRVLQMRRTFIAILVCCVFQTADAQESTTPDAPRFTGYPDAPSFSVVSRMSEMFFYPCGQCHDAIEPNPEIRALNVMHDAEIDHGDGRIWCLSCHHFENRDSMRTLLGEPVDFDESHLVCAGCHASRHRDWAFGVHGKRVDTWQGARIQYNCTHCHNPHAPGIEPRAPAPAPPARAGLELEKVEAHEKTAPWEREESKER